VQILRYPVTVTGGSFPKGKAPFKEPEPQEEAYRALSNHWKNAGKKTAPVSLGRSAEPAVFCESGCF
jgi:hypothetical protein